MTLAAAKTAPPQSNGRVAPHNLQAEESLLGAALLSSEALEVLATTTAPEDFYRPTHGHVAAALTRAYEEGWKPDAVTIAEELDRQGVLEQVGGSSALNSLVVNTPATSNAGRYARVVHRLAGSRRLIALAGELAEAGYATDDPAPILGRLAQLGRDSINLDRPFDRVAIDLTVPVCPPTMLNRWVYGGPMLTLLMGQPGAGKTLVSQTITVDELHQDHDVIYLDEEGGPDITTERLTALGADPQAVAEHLFYFSFEGRRWNDDDLDALDQVIASAPAATLVVLDSLPDFLSAAGKSEDSAQDVTWFVNTVLRRFRQAGIAQLILDHLPKAPPGGDSRKRSPYSRGSGAKLAKTDATLLLEVAEEFDAAHSGRLHLWKTKDRRGRLNLPTLAKAPLELVVTVGGGSIRITEAEPVEHEGWDGPSECMAVVADILQAVHPDELAGNRLIDQVRIHGHTFRDRTVREAAERLALVGQLVARSGPRRSRLYRWNPDHDDELEEEF